MPNNKRVVEATFLRTEKQLAKEPEWKVAYAAQLHDIIDRRAATKLDKDRIIRWNGTVWNVSHLIAGLSLNDLLMKVLDVLSRFTLSH